MNRLLGVLRQVALGVPRRRGDEPMQGAWGKLQAERSPQARG
jgi:hypothetical protein